MPKLSTRYVLFGERPKHDTIQLFHLVAKVFEYSSYHSVSTNVNLYAQHIAISSYDS